MADWLSVASAMPTFASKTAAVLARHVRHNYSLELYGAGDRVQFDDLALVWL